MFKDTCLALCFDTEVVVNVNEACGDKRREMPKPVVGQACNQGYEAGYEAAKAMYSDEAAVAREEKARLAAVAEREAAVEAAKVKAAEEGAAAFRKSILEKEEGDAAEGEGEGEGEAPAAEDAAASEEAEPAAEAGNLRANAVEEAVADARKVIATLPVTVDEADINLLIYEGQEAMAAVDAFCKEHMAAAGSACVDQLLPHVQRKLAEKL